MKKNKRLLSPENVCLQVIDVQQSLMTKIHESDKVAATVELMLDSARILKIPIVANTQYKKGLGPYVPNIESLVSDIPRFDKVEFNAVKNSGTGVFLDALPKTVTTIALVGVETHICIYQTAMGLLDRGLLVWVISDGVSSRYREDHQEGLSRMLNAGVTVGPSEMLIYELLGKAGTPEFKKILPYITGKNA
ncbi:MAG: isochorismatase family protein [Desulfobulbaceae bacterium]|nr:isochorismatase family protein [Desulfobulbaceae bacterium]